MSTDNVTPLPEEPEIATFIQEYARAYCERRQAAREAGIFDSRPEHQRLVEWLVITEQLSREDAEQICDRVDMMNTETIFHYAAIGLIRGEEDV